MKISIRDLEYLIEVAKTKSFSKAAKSCFVSQPTLSYQLKKLESSYNIKIFERHPKKVIITQEGKLLINTAKEILLQCQKFEDIAKSISSPLSGTFTLGIIPTVGPYLLPKIINKLKNKFSDLTFYFEEAQTHKCIEQLVTGQIDACILAYPLAKEHKDSQIKSIELFFEPFYLACNNENHLQLKKEVSVSSLKNEKVMLLADGHCLSEHTINACGFSKSNNVKSFRATSLETLRAMIASGDSVAIIPKHACIPYKNLNYIPFDNKSIGRSVNLCFRKSDPRELLINKLVDVIR